MRVLLAAAAAVLLTSAAAAETIRLAQPAKTRPGNLLSDTLRREKGLLRFAMVWAPEIPRARAKAQAGPQPQVVGGGRFYDTTFSPTATWLDVFSAGGSVRVSLDLDNLPVRDALKQVFSQTKLTHTVDADVPQEARVTVKAANVQLHTALSLITEAAGVGWTIEHREIAPPAGQPLQGVARTLVLTYRIGKSVSRGVALSRIMTHQGGGFEAASGLKLPDNLVPYAIWGREERSTFTCPHCKVQSTLVRVKHQPKCAKCERLYQPEWQFCPADGSKRPAPPVEWRFCPSCGKGVQPDKAEEVGDLLESIAPPVEPDAPQPPPTAGQPEPVGFIPRVGPVEDL